MTSERDAYLDQVLIGGRERRPIVIVAYDQNWPKQFERLAERVTAALGDKALSVEHIGSTAVPGLPAKPIIDMLLLVEDVEDEAAYVPPLLDGGFVLRVRDRGHRMLRTPEKDAHLHVYNAGAEEITDYRALRD